VVAVRPVLGPEPPAAPRVDFVVPIGGVLTDGAFAGGSLWVADSAGSALLRVDLEAREVGARIPLQDAPEAIVPGEEGTLWVRTGDPGGLGAHVVRLDPASGRVTTRVPSTSGNAFAVGDERLWVTSHGPASDRIEEVDAATGRRIRRIDLVRAVGVAVGGDVVWAITHNGTVAQIDAGSGRIVRRWTQLAPPAVGSAPERVLAADAAGVWVLNADSPSILRIESGRIARRIPVEPGVRPLLALGSGALWYAEGTDVPARNRVHRIDPISGKRTGSVDVGAHRPVALVPAGDRLAVVGGDGSVVLIAP
jgi:streptogramin lyase